MTEVTSKISKNIY